MNHSILSSGLTISYSDNGKGNTTLLFVHGSYINKTYWTKQVDYFKPAYRVITMDLAGHGESGKNRENWTIEGFGDDVLQLIRELKLENVILIGHSVAGDVNLVAAVNDPSAIIGFIGVDTFKLAATAMPPEFQEQIKAIKQNLKTNFKNTNEQYARMALLTQQTPPAITGRILNEYRGAYEPMAAPITNQVFDFYIKEQELLPKLNFKLFLINVDYMPTNEEPLKKFPGKGYKLLHLRGTSHYPMIENPDLLNQALAEAITEIEQGRKP